MKPEEKVLAATRGLSCVTRAYRAAVAAKRTVTALLIGYTVVRTAVILRVLTK